jgi:D-3-phosphoglycerate dehydrogenase
MVKLVYFDRWFDPIAPEILDATDDLTLTRLSYDDPDEQIWNVLGATHGYQVQARTELRGPYFVDADLLARMPNLLAVSSAGAGHDVIDVDACTAAGVVVMNQTGTNSESVAEHTLGMILALSKRMWEGSRALAAGQAGDRWQLVGSDIRGRTLGIVGLGNIGRLVAGYAATFGMTVVAHDPYLDPHEIEIRGARAVSFDELVTTSDFVTVHCPRNASTLDMFTAEQFAQMKPTAYFINTARGGIHRERDVLDALESGQLAGAGLDVFDDEPPAPNNPLLASELVIATPHVAGVTTDAFRAMSVAAARQWVTLSTGGVPPRLVDPKVWPLYRDRFAELIGFSPDPIRSD